MYKEVVMNKYSLFTITITFGLLLFTNASSEETQYQSKPPPLALKRFVALEGEWTGNHINHQGKKEQVDLIYRTVSGGTAVEERIFADTPNEMITIYHGADDGGILMTHYCMLGNQPRLQLENSSENTFIFKFIDGVGIDREKTGHMGGVKINFLDENTMQQEWDYYEEGKVKNTSTITFTRK